jgi:hypothetical protein
VPLARIAPFAVVAGLAELSLILPPGWASTPAAVVSLVLLVAVPAMMLLRRDRMPSWTPVLVPLAYAGSVLALLLTVGSTSGVAIVILIPLIWTGLYHRRWESACVVAAIVAVEITVSLVPVRVGDAVLFRRRTVDRAGHADLRGHARAAGQHPARPGAADPGRGPAARAARAGGPGAHRRRPPGPCRPAAAHGRAGPGIGRVHDLRPARVTPDRRGPAGTRRGPPG